MPEMTAVATLDPPAAAERLAAPELLRRIIEVSKTARPRRS